MARPIIPWPGGKRRLLKHLLSDIPEHTTYVEVFAGGLALLLAKEPSKAEVVNDLDAELVRLYRCVQHHLDELVRQFRWALVSRKMFEWAAMQRPDTLTDIQRAAMSQAHLRLARVTIECLPWADCVARYDRPGTLFFLDPPYWQTAGYASSFPREEYDRLAAVMGSIKGKAILTINDHPAMRKVFADFRRQRVDISYTIGGGKPKKAGELIYRTW